MKKICYVVSEAHVVRTFFMNQLHCLAQHGYHQSVVCALDKKLYDQLGDEIAYFPIAIPRGQSLVGTIKAIVCLYKLFRKHKFDMVQYSTPNGGFCGAVASKLAGIKIRNYHLMGLRYTGESGLLRVVLRLLDKCACALSSHIECVSHSCMQAAVDDGLFDPAKATVIWNGSTCGVDVERFVLGKKEEWRMRLHAKFEIQPLDFVIGFVGRITRDKGINELIKAFAQFSQEYSAVLLLVGLVENEQWLESELYHWALTNDRVRWCGFCEDVQRHYAMMDLLVLPSYREGFGNVLIEAGAMQVPIVASNIPGPIDVIQHGETGWMVQPKDEQSLYNAFVHLYNNRALCERLAQNNYQLSVCKFESKQLCQYILARKKQLLDK